ncbi:divergent polysaccharide deacetylase family protein, partial [Bacillus amyloliquefaciens]|uniref:divergent polysaccharide deacetylase family protein n=1 Tax=Bacillus amyloliquefaciens TaxID=1390 RepID=UPI0037CE0735
LDSKTNYKSVAAKVAREMGVPYAVNQLFLDDVHTASHITKQMEKVCFQLRERKICVAIGHVGSAGKKTASILRQYIPRIQK